MDDDIYSADGQPHNPPSTHDQRGSGSEDPDGHLSASDPSTKIFSKTLPNQPSEPRNLNYTHEDAGHEPRDGAWGTNNDGNGRNNLISEGLPLMNFLISSVPERVSSSSQNRSNELGFENQTVGEGEEDPGATNDQYMPSSEILINSRLTPNESLDGPAKRFSAPIKSPGYEWQTGIPGRINGVHISSRNNTYRRLSSSRGLLRDGDGIPANRNTPDLIERDPTWEPLRASTSTVSDGAGGEYSGQITAPTRSIRGAARFGQVVREVVLPRWQPDAEVTYCPICRTQFNFFVRKHHCRRCGRVVCNACSPHRITIPYQFIVQPPAAILISSSVATTQLGSHRDSFMEDLTSNFADRDGGMKVRLCNPCVPDPNPLPPQQFPTETGPPTLYLTRENRPRSYIDESTSGNIGRVRGLSAASALRASDTANIVANNRLPLLPPTVQPFDYSRPMPSNTPLRGQDLSPSMPRSPYSSSPGQSSQNRGHGIRQHHQSLSFTPGASVPNLQPHYRSLLDVGGDRHARTPGPPRPLPPVPRLEEDDICPVCHRALPSRAYPDFEDRRAAHITQCINEQLIIHSGHSRPEAHTSQSQPVPSSTAPEASNGPPPQQPPTPVPAATIHPLAPPALSTPESRAAAREAAHASVVLGYNNNTNSAHRSLSGSPARRTGMFLYLASEKDCVDDAECTICLEEFVVGAHMARLECFCRFHRKCIGDWFVAHPGRCPVHSHDGFGF